MSDRSKAIPPRAQGQARAMRREPTDAERAMWRLLRDRRLTGIKWRRQTPIGPYIVDFLCYERRVVVECDGSQHSENNRDKTRDAWLEGQGFRVLRFWNHEVLSARAGVLDTILAGAGLPI